MTRIDVVSELMSSAVFPRLKGKKILFAITGSVAAYRMVDVCRELIRLGAEIHVMMTKDALNLVGKATFEWATGNVVITEITGNIEHVLFAGQHSDKVDLMVIAPITANTLSKIANGISDTSVSLTATVAIGNSIPLLLIPGMHEPMYRNLIIKENIKKLKNVSCISLLDPLIEEGKAKVPENENIIYSAIKLLTQQTLKNKHVLITGGATREYVDQVRFISNPSSGKTALFLALESWFRGASVTLIIANTQFLNLPFLTVQSKSTDQMQKDIEKIIENKSPDLIILSAAVSDFKPADKFEGKISSSTQKLQINLVPTVKIVKIIKKFAPNCKLVAFKAEYGPTKDKLLEIFSKYQKESGIDFMIANDIAEEGAGFGGDYNHIWIISSKSIQEFRAHKKELAYHIINNLEEI